MEVLKQGDSLALYYAPKPDQDITPWACSVKVRADKEGADTVAPFSLTDASSNGRARVGLLDTTSIPPGTYFVLAKLSNATTGESKEIHEAIRIETSAFTA